VTLIKCDVLVAGAGLAGLTAAYMLSRHGHRVAVVEANERPGGRTACSNLESGLTVELGGEWVGRSHTFAIGACRQLGIGLAVHSFLSREKVVEAGPNGNTARPSYEVNCMPKLKGLLRNSRARSVMGNKDVPWKDFLAQVMSDEEIEMARACHELIFAQPLETISAQRAVHHVLKGGRNLHEDFRIEGGTEKLVNGLCSELEGSIHCREQVRSVFDNGQTIRARTDSADYEAGFLVCALPPRQVLAIDWHPALPAKMTRWLAGITFCSVTKTFFQFERPFWTSDDFSLVTGTVYQHVYHTAGSIPDGPAVLVAYSTGDASRKAGSLLDADALAALRSALPHEQADFDATGVKVTRKSWDPDAFSSGAYSVFATGEGFEARSTFQTLNSRIHFAGEHLGEMQGLMDGAIETGWRAADLIHLSAQAKKAELVPHRHELAAQQELSGA
jgi:monoamine oxidase